MKMKDNVISIGTNHIKEASLPAMMAEMETSDATIVIHLHKGRWSMQHIKGATPLWSLIGILQSLVTHFSNVANGLVKLK